MDLNEINARIAKLNKWIAEDMREVLELCKKRKEMQEDMRIEAILKEKREEKMKMEEKKKMKMEEMKRLMAILQEFEDMENEEGTCDLIQCPEGCDYYVCESCIKTGGRKYTHCGKCKTVIIV